jgi:coenzyme F420 hydrogenase subunit beta
MEHAPSNKTRQALKRVIKAGLCTSCGLCVSFDRSAQSRMLDTDYGQIPYISPKADFDPDPCSYCPALGIDYDTLYKKHYGRHPDNWLIGPFEQLFIGHSLDSEVRGQASSGGVLSQVLIHLLDSARVDKLILAKQGSPRPHLARPVLIADPHDVLTCAQSIYTPVAMLSILPLLDPAKRYAITLLPDAAAALRKLQHDGHPQALAIKYVLGPYTGTQIYPLALRYFFKALRIKDYAELEYLKWRAGEWPGYLEMKAKNGRVVRSKKIYYNFLIPFYITQACRLSIDFANEFCDLSVGDAWSPKYEALGQGFSVVAVRKPMMQSILDEMHADGKLHLETVTWDEASKMHGHMIDFKKRGAFIRMRFRKACGMPNPRYSIEPKALSPGRKMVELVNISLFALAGTPLARAVLNLLPEALMGALFNRLRIQWKALSKPTKRKSLGSLQMRVIRHDQ